MKPVEIGYKSARKECREKAIKTGYGYWYLAWSKERGFYAVDEWKREYGWISPNSSDPNIICAVEKSGYFMWVKKKEYVSRFHLTDKQKQPGQRYYSRNFLPIKRNR